MEERTFHLFSHLPLELREHIWKMVMRSDRPGVQTFRVYDPELDNPGHAEDVMGFAINNGTPHLIVLQFDDIFNFEWNFLDDLFCYNKDSYLEVVNIGIEYNQEWGLELYNDDQNGDSEPIDFALYKLFELAEDMMYLSIWLIDHNLKRRKEAPSFKDSDKHELLNPSLDTPFYANDRKFLKVNLEQGEQCLDYWQYIKPIPDGDYQKSSLYFADRLRQQVCDFACRGDCIVSHCSCYPGLLEH
ncbi:hypothetical protein NW760_001088 [Fusarium oxysporum]|nr:hypothetical protein NW769_004975 [Fusarium oxysporum]KAJ4240806.1 hypothetical protein NW760_001088 [Fusarium oxysporum]